MSSDRWISVGDSLPIVGQLVYAKSEGVYTDRIVTFWRRAKWPHFGRLDEHDGKGSQPATHWRPL